MLFVCFSIFGPATLAIAVQTEAPDAGPCCPWSPLFLVKEAPHPSVVGLSSVRGRFRAEASEANATDALGTVRVCEPNLRAVEPKSAEHIGAAAIPLVAEKRSFRFPPLCWSKVCAFRALVVPL